MKLQNMAVIFSIIVIPMTLILSVYIGFQIDTASKIQIYDAKLLDATHDAVVAFQINTAENNNSTIVDSLRRDVTASINTLFTSLAANLGAPAEGMAYIMGYVPAVMFTLYDGYYIYSPIEVEYKQADGTVATKYEHALKPYIPYAVKYKDRNNSIVVNYSLDNYISIYGYLDSEYICRAGYLIADPENIRIEGDGTVFYNGIEITDEDGKSYYKEAKEFTEYVKSTSGIVETVRPQYAINAENGKYYEEFKNDNRKILDVSKTPDSNNNINNDPEEKDSYFNAHKREVMKMSIQSSLSNAIYTYSEHAVITHDFAMPVLTEPDWDKLLSNVNIVTFMQGIPVGTKIYNNYTIVTSTENKQYIDVDMIYYTAKDNENEYYHKIDCPNLKKLVEDGNEIVGYRNIDLNKKQAKKDAEGKDLKDKDGNIIYEYKIKNPACYECIVNSNYKKENSISDKLKAVYYNTVARERYNLNKVTQILEGENKTTNN